MIANHKGEIPVVVLLLPFLLGIGLGINLLSGADIGWLRVGLFALSITFIVLNLNYSRFKLYKLRWLGGSLITIILFLFGWTLGIQHNELNNSDHFSKTKAQYLVVKINKEPVLKNGLLRFTANVEQCVNKEKHIPVSGTLLITVKDSSAKKLCYGDELLIPAKYNAIEPPMIPAEFNYKQYLANQNIFYQVYLHPKQFTVLAADKGNPLIAYSLRLRQHLVEKLKLNMRDTDAMAVASTLILGYKADLSSNVLQAYSKTGTVYVLSVSGSQVGIIFILLMLILKFLDRYKYGRLIRAIIIIAVIWYYAILTGFSLAICRVAVMVTMLIIGKTFNRYINTLNVLAISAFLLLLYDPFFITEVGFQLSYVAIFGLIVFQPLVYEWLKFKNRWANKLWSFCSASIAAQIVTFPLCAFYFHQLPVCFLISNLFIIIPSAVIMYTGILYLSLPQIPFVSKAVAFIMQQTIVLMNKTLTVIEHAPFASINKVWITTAEFLLLYTIIISLFYFLYDKKLWMMKLSLFATLILCFSLSFKKFSLQNEDTITWLNLKKHKGIIFKHGNEGIVISDILSSDKIYQFSIQPYLDSCKINNVRLVAMDQNFQIGWFIKKYNFIQFLNKRILIFDRPVKNNIDTAKLNTNYIYLTNNELNDINSLDNHFNFNSLIVDGSNSDKFISRIQNQASQQHINYTILKRNKSLASVSN